ncbi:Hypothetical protein, putative, partial [Bodo saltans]
IDRDALQVGFVEGTDGVVLRAIQFDTRTTTNPNYVTEMSTAAGKIERLRRELQTALDDAEDVQLCQQATEKLMDRALNAVVLSDLPKSIDRDALQVGFVEGTDGVVLRAIQFDTRTTTNPNYVTEMSTAAGKIERLRRELQTALDDAEDVQLCQQATEKLMDRALSADSGEGPAVFDPARWAAIVNTHAMRVQAELAAQRVLEDKFTVLRAELADAERCQLIAVPEDLTQSVVTVLLSARAAIANVVLSVSYLVAGASWESEYEIRVDSEARRMAVHYHGVVRQSTEEAWTDVRVSLSTARPTISRSQPEMTPWRVGVFVAPVKFSRLSWVRQDRGGGDRRRGIDDQCHDETNLNRLLFSEGVLWSCQRIEEEDDDELLQYQPVAIEAAAVEEAATSVSFGVARPMTITRDGEAVRAVLVTLELDVALTHVTVPSVLETVFATAKATNTTEVPLASGNASVFLDGQFVTHSTLPRTPVREELRVSIGRDEGVTVHRKLLNTKRSDESGMCSSLRRDLVTHTFATTLRNGRRQAVEVLVQERVPCSDSDDLVVTFVHPKVASLSKEQQAKLCVDGIVEKLVKVAPGATVDYQFEFTVSSPEGSHVYGV